MFLFSCAVNPDALAVATAKAFSDPTLAPSLVAAYAAAIAQSGCPAVQPALASAPLLSLQSWSTCAPSAHSIALRIAAWTAYNTPAPLSVNAYTAAIAQSGCPSVQPALTLVNLN